MNFLGHEIPRTRTKEEFIRFDSFCTVATIFKQTATQVQVFGSCLHRSMNNCRFILLCWYPRFEAPKVENWWSLTFSDCHLVAAFLWVNRDRFHKAPWLYTLIRSLVLCCVTKAKQSIKTASADADKRLSVEGYLGFYVEVHSRWE